MLQNWFRGQPAQTPQACSHWTRVTSICSTSRGVQRPTLWGERSKEILGYCATQNPGSIRARIDSFIPQ